MVLAARKRNDSDEFSDTTSELASAIHSSSFASQRRTSFVTSTTTNNGHPSDSTMAQAGGDGCHHTNEAVGESHSSSLLVHTREADETNNNRNTTLALVAFIAIVVAIAAAFLSTRGKNDDSMDRPSTIVDQVIQEVSSNSALRDTNSPQSRARGWMIGVDQLTERIVAEGVNRIHQRYALATLYFAAEGAKWNRSVGTNEPLFQFVNPETSECEWFGVKCASDQEGSDATRRLLQETAVSPIASNQLNNTVFGLILPGRNLTGALPPELGSMSYLRRIDLSSNQLNGIISDSILGRMKDLWWLDLSDNHFTGLIPSSLWNLPKLSHLFLFRNRLSGKIERAPVTPVTSDKSSTNEEESAPVKPLIQVYLYENQLTGPMPPWFHELNSLEHWVSYKNQLTGPLPQVLPEKLSFYDLSFNQFTGTLPDSLWATFPAPPLETLYLEHNRLTGSIPNTTNVQPFLKLVSIHNNRLGGTIPEGFGISWTSLKELRLQNNTLTGPIPPTFWRNAESPPKLTHLNLSFNSFSGTLPNSTQVRSLQEVRLRQNPALRGAIPDRFGYAWPNLTSLEIQGTSLEGQLGPFVAAGDERTECPEIWPLYSEVVTSFRVSANCIRLFVTDPEPPVQCYCCTNCVAA